MNTEQNHGLDESLAYMREQFRPLTQSIPIPDSLQPDILRRKLDEMLEQEEIQPVPSSVVVAFPWRRIIGVAACLVVVVGSYFMLDNTNRLTPAPMDAPSSSAAAAGMAEAAALQEDEGMAIPDAALFAAPTPETTLEDGLVGSQKTRGMETSTEMDKELEAISSADNMIESLEEAAAQKPFGDYLPQMLPEGMVEVQAFSNDQSLFLSSYGEKSDKALHCQVFKKGSDIDAVLVDPADPKTWDMRLYSIPWEASVSPEYVWVISDAVFRAEDITLEMVRARNMVLDNAEKIGSAWAQFGVLYDEVVVRYQATGISSEELYRIIEQTRMKDK